MPSTLQALLVLILAVLPGALYVWGFEREAGKWGIGLSDALLRFIAASAMFQALFAVPLWSLYHEYLHADVVGNGRPALRNGNPLHTNRLAEGDVPAWFALVPIAYVAIPTGLGTAVGRAVQSRKPRVQSVARVMAGKNPAPRGWDNLFTSRPSGTVRARLSDGTWIGGAFGEASYAAGYPEKPRKRAKGGPQAAERTRRVVERLVVQAVTAGQPPATSASATLRACASGSSR